MFLWNYEADQLCFKLLDIGFDALDIWFESPSLYLVDKQIAREKVAVIRQAPITKVSHIASHDLNPCSYSREVRDLAFRQAQKSILYAADMGANFVTIHGGHNSFGKKCSAYDEELFFEYLRNLLDWNPTIVVLTIENSPSVHYKLLNSSTAVLRVLEEFKEMKLTFDYAHVPLETSDAWGDMLCQYHNRLAIVHVSSEKQEHRRPEFDGRLSGFLGWLKGTASNIILILEYEQENMITFPLRILEEDARKIRELWKAVEIKRDLPLGLG